jgi:hypothetical protein
MPFDGLPSQQPDPARQAVHIRQRIDPRHDRLIRDKLRLANEQLRKDIKKTTAEIRFANRRNADEATVERAVSQMWEQKVDDHAGVCYEILCHHWSVLGERKTSAFVRVSLDILLPLIEGLGRSAAHEANRAHYARGAIGTSPVGLYEDSVRAICERWRTKLDIEARELDLVAASRKTPETPAHPVLGDWIINQKLQELERDYQNDQKNKPHEIELSSIGNPRGAAIQYTAERLKQYVDEIKGVYKAEIGSGRFANEPSLWVYVYRDKILPSVKASRLSVVGDHAFRLMRTGGGGPGEKETVEEAQRDLDHFVAQLEGELATAIEHADRTPLTDRPQILTHETNERGLQTSKGQFSADSVQLSKGVREGKTVELLYDQLKRIRSLYRDNGWPAAQIRKNTEEDLAIAWEWIDRISDQAHKSEFQKISQWEDGDRFIFLQIAALYRYDPHLKREPGWGTVRDWRKAYRGHLQHGTPDGRKPRR